MNKVTSKDFCTYHHLGSLTISPDENNAIFADVIADLKEDTYLSNLWLLNLNTNETRQLTSGNNERKGIWLDNEHILFTSNRENDVKEKMKEYETYTCFYKLNIYKGEATLLFKTKLRVASYKLIDSSTLLVSAVCNAFRKDFFECDNEEEINSYKKEMKSLKEYEYFDEIPFWANGEGIINGKRMCLFLLNMNTLETTQITDTKGNASILDVKDNKVLYSLNPMNEKRVIASSLHYYDIKTNTHIKLVEEDQYAINFAFFVKDKIIASLASFETYGYHQHGSLYEISLDTTKKHLVHFDNSYGAFLGSDCIQMIGSPLKVYEDKIYFTCTDENDGCVKYFDTLGNITKISDYNGGIEDFEVCSKGIYFIGLRNHKLQEIYHLNKEEEVQLTNFNTEVMNTTSISPIHKFAFESDGIKHEGFVIYPTDFNPNKKYPGILEIHGGPKATFGPVISHQAQYFASNGYFVFFANPRGSDSRGNAFADIRGRFGKEDYDDLMNFTKAVLKQCPNLDENRLGVTGSSYGGYMSNWIITQTDLFKAAIPEASISNYITKFLTTDIGFTYNISNQNADPWSDLDLVWEQSPLKYANKVTTPTLFIHSDQDYRCWIAEAIQMYYALKLHGCKTRFLLFHNEHHGLRIFGKPTHRVARLEAMLSWFDTYLK